MEVYRVEQKWTRKNESAITNVREKWNLKNVTATI